jgi:hypothetical protein
LISTSDTNTTAVPWAVEFSTNIAYNTTSTKSTNVTLCASESTRDERLTVDFFNTVTVTHNHVHVGNLIYTDPTGSSFLSRTLQLHD